jgi:hypothetical protein
VSTNYLRELDEESYALLPDCRILIERAAFESISDYTRSQPTSPSAGRVYRKNLSWHPDCSDIWFVYIVRSDPYQHCLYKVEIVGEVDQ